MNKLSSILLASLWIFIAAASSVLFVLACVEHIYTIPGLLMVLGITMFSITQAYKGVNNVKLGIKLDKHAKQIEARVLEKYSKLRGKYYTYYVHMQIPSMNNEISLSTAKKFWELLEINDTVILDEYDGIVRINQDATRKFNGV
ncbi:MAG: hypothetical protein NC548_10785 [Lachnospiraceae bacterium]|nr:hypothetical protein [Lachnospiraceae bacterium]MCM1236815.1 hypothetical protein [Ruminococcus flavefaciens]